MKWVSGMKPTANTWLYRANREHDTQCHCNLGTEKAEEEVCKFNARLGT